jgi:hypothetical protein
MNAKHTPGPWLVSTGYHPHIETASGVALAKTDCSISRSRFVEDGYVARANATLMASAPELLEALEGLAHADGCYCDAAFSMSDGSHPSHAPECQKARAAIAKAKGEA